MRLGALDDVWLTGVKALFSFFIFFLFAFYDQGTHAIWEAFATLGNAFRGKFQRSLAVEAGLAVTYHGEAQRTAAE